MDASGYWVEALGPPCQNIGARGCEVGPFEIGSPQVCATQVGPLQSCAGEQAINKSGSKEVGVGELGSAQVRGRKIK
jgi:hypothetical protein